MSWFPDLVAVSVSMILVPLATSCGTLSPSMRIVWTCFGCTVNPVGADPTKLGCEDSILNNDNASLQSSSIC